MVINDRRVAGANVKPRGLVFIRAPTAVLSKIFMYGLLIVERESRACVKPLVRIYHLSRRKEKLQRKAAVAPDKTRSLCQNVGFGDCSMISYHSS